MPDPIKATPVDNGRGSPITPVGDPMLAGVGPGAANPRPDRPDRTVFGEPKVQPMRVLPGWIIGPGDPDPRGFPVEGCDGNVAGTIVDVWVDRAEPQIRYYEVQLAGSEQRRLLPNGFVQWPNFGLFGVDKALVKAITAAQFANVPTTKLADQITMDEEERIVAYYAGGYLYATPDRLEPLTGF